MELLVWTMEETFFFSFISRSWVYYRTWWQYQLSLKKFGEGRELTRLCSSVTDSPFYAPKKYCISMLAMQAT